MAISQNGDANDATAGGHMTTKRREKDPSLVMKYLDLVADGALCGLCQLLVGWLNHYTPSR